jgi:hypothetical protein
VFCFSPLTELRHAGDCERRGGSVAVACTAEFRPGHPGGIRCRRGKNVASRPTYASRPASGVINDSRAIIGPSGSRRCRDKGCGEATTNKDCGEAAVHAPATHIVRASLSHPLDLVQWRPREESTLRPSVRKPLVYPELLSEHSVERVHIKLDVR